MVTLAFSPPGSRPAKGVAPRRTLTWAMVALLGVGLAGCAGTSGPATDSTTPATGNQGGQDVLSRGGYYKVGDPYQINGVWYYPAEDYNYDETGIASWYGPGFHAKMSANGETFDQNDVTAAHRTLPMPSYVRVTNLENGRSLVVRINDRGPYARGRILDLSRRSAQLLGIEGQGTARVRVQIMAEESKAIAQAMRSAGRTGGGQGSRAPMIASRQPGEPAPSAAPRASISAETLPGSVSADAARPAQPTASSSPPPRPTPDPAGQLTQTTPKRTQLFVQAGSFSNADNANRLSSKLHGFGSAKVVPFRNGSQMFYRVRVGPLATVEEGDRVLEKVINSGSPDAKLIAD